MEKNILISIIIITILSILIGFVACSPDYKTPDELKDVKYLRTASVRGGKFTQKNDEGGNFEHTISDFYIGKYEVTYELWHTVYTWAIDKGYIFANAGIEGHDGIEGAYPTDAGKYEPVTTINWRDAIVWCNAYSEIWGFTPVYEDSKGNILKNSQDSNATVCDNIIMNMDVNGYRLPTGGEWQFAASKKGKIPYNYASGATEDYNDEDACKKVAWYNANSGGVTHTVGDKYANGLGLYDMSGNVWELCWDWYGYYPSDPQEDYTGPDTGYNRVKRGGDWSLDSNYLQVGYRYVIYPYIEHKTIGFRVARRH